MLLRKLVPILGSGLVWQNTNHVNKQKPVVSSVSFLALHRIFLKIHSLCERNEMSSKKHIKKVSFLNDTHTDHYKFMTKAQEMQQGSIHLSLSRDCASFCQGFPCESAFKETNSSFLHCKESDACLPRLLCGLKNFYDSRRYFLSFPTTSMRRKKAISIIWGCHNFRGKSTKTSKE